MSAILDFADRVKNQVDIVDIVGRYVELRQAGTNHKGLCPFHREKSPSFSVSSTKQIFHCFGCHEGGDAIKFVQKIERMEWKESLFHVARMYNIPVPEFKPVSDREKQEADQKPHIQAVCELALARFTSHLSNRMSNDQSEIYQYLKNRNLTPDIIEKFQLGLALDEWQDLLNWGGKHKFSSEIMLKAGVLNENASGRVYDRFRNRLIFPIHSIHGLPIAFGARVYLKSAAPDEPKYINSPETALYHKGSTLYGLHLSKENISRAGYAILTEGYLDVIRAHQNGFTATVASCGTALTEDQGKLLKRFCKTVYLAYDGDAAGQKAMFRACEILIDQDFAVKIIPFPAGHDPDSYLVEYGAEAFQKSMDNSKTFFEYFLEQLCKTSDIKSPEGKVYVVETILPLLKKIKKSIIKNAYVHRLAERLSLHESLIFKYLTDTNNEATEAFRQSIATQSDFQEENPIEVNLVRCFIDCARSRDFVRDNIRDEWIKSPGLQKIIQTLRAIPDESLTWDYVFKIFSDDITVTSFLRRIALSEQPCDTSEKTLKHVAARLHRHYIMEANKSLVNTIEAVSTDSDHWEESLQNYQNANQEVVRSISKNSYFLKQSLRSNK